MDNFEVYELLVDEQGRLFQGQKGGIKEILKKLEVMDAKLERLLTKVGTIDIINAKVPGGQTS